MHVLSQHNVLVGTGQIEFGPRTPVCVATKKGISLAVKGLLGTNTKGTGLQVSRAPVVPPQVRYDWTLLAPTSVPPSKQRYLEP